MHEQILTRITNYIEQHELIKPNEKIIIGLSGGPDSVFLLHVLHQLQDRYNLTLLAAHLDHEWRVESAQDAQFCKNLADKLKIPIIIERASQVTITKKTKSLEERGRLLRRKFFEKLALEHNAHKIALAHHADDQEETFFIRLLRGSTVTGLACMWPKSGLYIRPLLELSKSEILSYVTHENILFLTDPTNSSPLFLRNRIRAQVIPALRNCDARFSSNFAKTIEHIQETEQFLEQLTSNEYTGITRSQDGAIWLDYTKLLKLEKILQKRILIKWLCAVHVQFSLSDKFLDEIIKFLTHTKATTHAIHDQWHIIKKNGFAYIKK